MSRMMNGRLIAVLMVIFWVGCQEGQSPETFQPKRQVVSSVPSRLRPQATLVTYDNGDRAQVENGQEVAHFRKPTQQESVLQYWKQKYPNAQQFYEPISGSSAPQGHIPPLYQLRIPSKGVNVIYNSQSDRVEEVIEYAPL